MCVPIFNMVKYHGKYYPPEISLKCEELAAHFDIKSLKYSMPNYSLHTEYSYGIRNFDSQYVTKLHEICNAQKNNVPQLWKNKLWAKEFAEYIFNITQGLPAPDAIEVHPPFDDYTNDLNEFVKVYKNFEEIILDHFPQVNIMVENRCGSLYRGGNFVISKIETILELSNLIDTEDLKLKFALDIPQLYTAHNCTNNNCEKYFKLLSDIKSIRHNIAGVHLWGKKVSSKGRKVAHCGDLHSFFDNDTATLDIFLKYFLDVFSDGNVRKMVLEVNSGNEDMTSIIQDLIICGVLFT